LPLIGDLDATSLFLSFLITTVGFSVFLYGRKAQRPPYIVGGLLLMVYPYFTPTTTSTIVVGALVGVGIWAAVWLGW